MLEGNENDERDGDSSDDDLNGIDDVVDDDDELNGLEEHGNLEEGFGEVAREEEYGSDADSGDDIWEDERIPDPFSSSDDDDEDKEEEIERRDSEDSEELLALGKTYDSKEYFKLSVLRYSLKTRYDIKLYRSHARKVGAKCSDTDVNCPWRV